ncbi:hypothetical protein [uncultured Vagococcus sp.]|uniref:hypothetical protein n=1 Tax=uncultured Vagococcus sp. TaxID=189676 RepID=UPI0028D87148|nr:hypothetical protein [uncultured Vagococcus sp.]
MVVIIISMFSLLWKNWKYRHFSLLLFIFIVISMITENFISSSHGVLAFMLVGILVNQNQENER